MGERVLESGGESAEIVERVQPLAPSRPIARKLEPASEVSSVVAPISTQLPDPVSTNDEDDDLPRPGKVWSNDGPSLSELLKRQTQSAEAENAGAGSRGTSASNTGAAIESKSVEPAESATPAIVGSNVEPARIADLSETWRSLLDVLMSRSPGVHGLLSHARLDRIQGGQATIALADDHRGFAKFLENNGKREILTKTLSELLGQPMGLRIEIDAPLASPAVEKTEAPASPTENAPTRSAAPTNTPANLNANARNTRRPEPTSPPPAAVRTGAPPTPEQQQALMADPLIAALVRELGAEIKTIE